MTYAAKNYFPNLTCNCKTAYLDENGKLVYRTFDELYAEKEERCEKLKDGRASVVSAKHEIERILDGCPHKRRKSREIPLKEWHMHNIDITPSEIRQIMFSKEPNCDSFVVHRDGEVLIDESSLYLFLDFDMREKFRIGRSKWKEPE